MSYPSIPRLHLRLKKVGLVVNSAKLPALEFAHQAIAFITEREIDVVLDPRSAPVLGREDIAAGEEELASCDLLMTLGGDGTILGASRIAAHNSVPILGVHMGKFGFIAEFHPNDVLLALDQFLDDGFPVEERMMVQGQVIRDGKSVISTFGLNEIVLSKGSRARMLRMETRFADEVISTYEADGLVISTPTGSTAYALSAGGPLVHPSMQALVIVPICAHTLGARPVVLPGEQTVSIVLGDDGGEALLMADSIDVHTLQPGDRLVVQRSPYVTRIVSAGSGSYVRKLRNRLRWGERLND